MIESITNKTIKNPFAACTARDMGYTEVNQYWCPPFSFYGLNENELFSSVTPIIIEGTRGTGKTMILKHMSYWVQKIMGKSVDKEDIIAHLDFTGIGVYFRYKADFCNMLMDIELPKSERNVFFLAYYNLFIAKEIGEILGDLLYTDMEGYGNYCINMGKELSIQIENAKEIPEILYLRISQLDEMINEGFLSGEWGEALSFARQYISLVNRTVKTAGNITSISSIRFILLIDEYENASDFQGVINTLIKQSDQSIPISYRIGMRPRGMENNATLVANEKLQPDRDYLLRELVFDDNRKYREFIISVCKRRLSNEPFYQQNGLTDIVKILGLKENIDEEADTVAREKTMYELLSDKYSIDEIEEVKDELHAPKKLMEMYNILRVLRGEEYHLTGKLSRAYCEGYKYHGDLEEAQINYKSGYSDKYRMSLLYLLLSISKTKKKMYYSFNTYIYLSSGAVNDFISLCRNAFNYCDDDFMRRLLKGDTINQNVQTKAAIQTAQDQLKKLSMSQKYGKEMYTFVDNMGMLFGDYHRDQYVKYPETNQFAFENEAEIIQDEELNDYFVELVNSGAVIQPVKKQRISIGKRKGNIYKLNRIYAPIYQYSYRTRGGYNHILNKDTFLKALKTTVSSPKELFFDKEKRRKKEDDIYGQMTLDSLRRQ